ncbi:hypothetical protein HUA74_44335 [Myxococcus sp. CA051A]|uniref:hypothetical protein n=1 Tax=Myxococcus sp. CA051A TaxID=2741739 RepID=UPI00157A3C9D|nr:hypothetical protein [Myxococcus sp. CA051A]NTX67698.1 hypothetical protein [Myxococcus sp. CA051A]
MALHFALMGFVVLASRASAGEACRDVGEVSDVVSCMTDPEDWEHLSCDTRCKKDYCVALRNDSPLPGMPADWCLVVTDRKGTVTGSLALTGTEDAKVTRASEAGGIDVRGRDEARRTFVLRSKRRKDGSLVELARTTERGPTTALTPLPEPRPQPKSKPQEAYCSIEPSNSEPTLAPPTCTGRKPAASFLQEAAKLCATSAGAGEQPVSAVGSCSASACIALGADEGVWECVVGQSDGGAPHVLKFAEVLGSSGLTGVALTGTTVCATFVQGGGSGGDIVSSACVLIGSPDRLVLPAPPSRVAFLDEEGYHTVPMKAEPTVDGDIAGDAAWGPVQPLPALTDSNVIHGLGAWEGPLDASVTWRLAQGADALYLAAQVGDDRVTPARPGLSPVFADHLELRPYYAVVLEPEGHASLRQWRDFRGTRVDWPVRGARCRWRARQGGQDIECRLPFGAVGALAVPPSRQDLLLVFSDGDGEPRQKSLVGTRVDLWLWKELPPSMEDAIYLKQTYP